MPEQEILKTNETFVDQANAIQIAERAWQAGQGFDMSDIGYGRVHWGNYRDIKNSPGPYYNFLAGVVAVCGCRRICEIGTHAGGATRAMYRGLQKGEDSRIVTIDVTRESDPNLRDIDLIKKVNGDANDDTVLASVLNEFSDSHKIDLLFIDGAHEYLSVMMNYGLYVHALSPRIVIMDDIKLNLEMRNLWQKIVGSRPETLWLDVAEMYPQVRNPSVGFGLLLYPDHDQIEPIHQSLKALSPVKKRIRQTVRYFASRHIGRI